MEENTYQNFRVQVPENYKEVFTHFYYAKNATQNDISQTLVPSFQTMLVFSLGPKDSIIIKTNPVLILNQCIILGPLKKATKYILKRGAEVLVANFTEKASSRFLKNNLFLEDPLLNLMKSLITKTCRIFALR